MWAWWRLVRPSVPQSVWEEMVKLILHSQHVHLGKSYWCRMVICVLDLYLTLKWSWLGLISPPPPKCKCPIVIGQTYTNCSLGPRKMWVPYSDRSGKKERNGQVHFAVPFGATFTKLTNYSSCMIYWNHMVVCVLDLHLTLEWPWLGRND